MGVVMVQRWICSNILVQDSEGCKIMGVVMRQGLGSYDKCKKDEKHMKDD